jgi:hypothetical protein
MTVLTTLNWPVSRNGRTDHGIGNTFRKPYSVPLPTQGGDTAPVQRGDCVGSQLVSTLPICYDEDTKHTPGRAPLTVSRGTLTTGQPGGIFLTIK